MRGGRAALSGPPGLQVYLRVQANARGQGCCNEHHDKDSAKAVRIAVVSSGELSPAP
jgi:hypothetical protein